jgi:hypothetical protein
MVAHPTEPAHRWDVMRGAAAIFVLALTACAGPVPSASPGQPSETAAAVASSPAQTATAPASQGLETPNATSPTAGICADMRTGSIVAFQLNVDTPNPRCGMVLGAQQLHVVNATGTTVTVTFHGVDYVLKPGGEQTFAPEFGSIWQPGDHWLRTSFYGGGGPEILLVAE